jgi:hypothetical protein
MGLSSRELRWASMSEEISNLSAGRARIGGRPRGVNITKRFTVALTARQYLDLNDVALFEGATMTAIVRRAIDQEIRRLVSRARAYRDATKLGESG